RNRFRRRENKFQSAAGDSASGPTRKIPPRKATDQKCPSPNVRNQSRDSPALPFAWKSKTSAHFYLRRFLARPRRCVRAPGPSHTAAREAESLSPQIGGENRNSSPRPPDLCRNK